MFTYLVRSLRSGSPRTQRPLTCEIVVFGVGTFTEMFLLNRIAGIVHHGLGTLIKLVLLNYFNIVSARFGTFVEVVLLDCLNADLGSGTILELVLSFFIVVGLGLGTLLQFMQRWLGRLVDSDAVSEIVVAIDQSNLGFKQICTCRPWIVLILLAASVGMFHDKGDILRLEVTQCSRFVVTLRKRKARPT